MSIRNVIALLAMCLLGCEADSSPPEPPDVIWSGTYLSYGTEDPDEALCGGTLAYMDRYVGNLRRTLGVEDDDDTVVEFFHLSEPELHCNAVDPLACTTKTSQVFSQVTPLEHELVHAVRAMNGLGHRLLEEGIAELYGGEQAFEFRGEPIGELTEAMDARTDGVLPLSLYARAGHFSSFIDQAYGIQPLIAIQEDTTLESGGEAALDALAGHAGVPVDLMLADYGTYPSCAQPEFRVPVHTCSEQPDLAPRCEFGQLQEIEVDLACDLETTIGPREGVIWTYRSLEIGRSGEYDFMIIPFEDELRDAVIEVKSCMGGCGSVAHEFDVPSSSMLPRFETLRLDAGRYVIRVSRPESQLGSVELRVWGAGCD